MLPNAEVIGSATASASAVIIRFNQPYLLQHQPSKIAGQFYARTERCMTSWLTLTPSPRFGVGSDFRLEPPDWATPLPNCACIQSKLAITLQAIQ
jgi:hypothetical protein